MNNPFDKPSPIVGPPIISNALNVPLQEYSNQYDDNYRPQYNQVWNRSANQSATEQLGYGLLSRTLSIGTKLGSGLGSILGLGAAAYNDDVTKIWDNPITNWFDSLDQGLKEALPVYSSEKNDTSGLFGKLSTTSFWANDGFDAIAYAVSAFVPGAVIGKAAKVVGGAAKATKFGAAVADSLATIGLDAHRAKLLSATTYNTVAESAAEAFQTQKELETIYAELGYDEAHAKLNAGTAASRVFNSNLLTVAVPNLIQNTLFHGGWNSLKKKIDDHVWDQKQLDKLESTWRKVGGSVASEGFWEENVQTSLQQWEKVAASTNNAGGDRVNEIGMTMANNIGGFFKSFWTDTSPEETEGATAIFLGGLIGGASATLSSIKEKKALKQGVETEKKKYASLFGEIGTAANNIFVKNVGSIYKTDGKKAVTKDDKTIEVTNYVLDKDGKPIIDSDAILNLTLNSLSNKHLWDSVSIAAYRNDPALAELTKRVSLGSFVYSLMNNKHSYSAEQVGKYLDKLQQIGTNEAKDLGIETYITDNISVAKQYAKDLEKTQSALSKNNQDAKTAAFNDYYTKTKFYLQIKQDALKSIQGQITTEEGAATVENMLTDTQDLLNTLTNDFSGVKKAYKETVLDRNDLAARYNEAKKKGTKELAKLQYLIDEESYINGDWFSYNTSSELTAQEIAIASAVKPGLRKASQYKVGKSLIALDRTLTALANKEDIADIADNFVNNVSRIAAKDTPLLESITQQIQSGLEEEKQSVFDEANALIGVAELRDNLYIDDYLLEEPIGNIGMPEPAVEALLIGVNKYGGNFTKISNTKELVDSPAYDQYLLEVNNKLQTVNSRVEELSKLRQLVDTKSTELYDDEEPIQNYRDQFLKEAVLDPAKYLLNIFNTDPTQFDDELSTTIIINRLQGAIAALGEDYSITLTNLLKLFTEVVLPQLENNINNRGAIHLEVNNKFVTKIVQSLQFSPEIKENFPNIQNIIESVTDDRVYSFDGVLELLHKIKTVHPEFVPDLVARLERQQDEVVNDYLSILDKDYPDLEKTTASVRNFRRLALRPHYHIFNIINRYVEAKGIDNKAFKRYKADFDVTAFAKNIQKTSATAEFKKLVTESEKIYTSLVSSNIVIDMMQSKLNTQKLNNLKMEMTLSPSLQQNIALTQGLVFLNSETKHDNFENWLLVRGIGGSGKTHFLGKELLRLQSELKTKPQNVYAFSKSLATTVNINKSLFEQPNSNSFLQFTNLTKQELSALDFIVIDEIFTFTNSEVLQIEKIARENNLKVIALGDASQITAELEPNLLSSLSAKMSIPLSTSYRTSVASISSFAQKYRLNTEKVTNVLANINKPISEVAQDSSTAYGVLSVESEDELIGILSSPSKRSKVLIVPTNTKKSFYENKVGVPVLTYAETQGAEWDEAYIIAPEFSDDDYFTQNKYLYTIYSRAKSLVVTTDEAVSSSITQVVDTQVSNSQSELQSISDMFKANLQGVTQVNLALVTGGTTDAITLSDVTPVEVLQENEPFSDATIANAMAVEDIVNLRDSSSKALGDYELLEPSNFGLTNFHNAARLARWSKAHFIKTERNGQVQFFVIAENQFSHPDKKKYFKLALLSRKDIELADDTLKDLYNTITTAPVPTIPYNLVSGSEFELGGSIDRISAGSIFIRDFLKFKTLFGETYYSASNLVNGAEDLIEDAIIRFYISYYTEEQQKQQDKPWVIETEKGWKVLWENIPTKAVQMLIPNKRTNKTTDKFAWRDADYNPRGLNIHYGVPHLVLTPSETAKPLLIRFQPQQISLTNPLIRTIGEFNNLVKTVTRITGIALSTKQFETLIQTYAKNNYTVEDKKLKLIDSPLPIEGFENNSELESAVQSMVEGVYGTEERPLAFGSEERAKEFLATNATYQEDTGFWMLNGNLITGIEKKHNKRFILRKSDDPVSPSTTSVYLEWKISEGKGPVQRALNTLARANNRIGNQQFRITTLAKDPGARSRVETIKIGRSPSILMSSPYVDYHGFYQDPLLADFFAEDLIQDFILKSSDLENNPDLFSELLNLLTVAVSQAENVPENAARSFALDMINEYRTPPVTTELLDAISDVSNFDSNTLTHKSIRTPLSINNLTKTGVNDLGENLKSNINRKALSDNLKHNFEGFQRSQVFFTLDQQTVAKPIEIEDIKPTSFKSLVEQIGTTGIDIYDKVLELIRKSGVEMPIINLPNGVPYRVKEDGVSVIKYGIGASTIIDGDQTGIYYSHNLFDNVEKDQTALGLFLHEGLHAITLSGLLKGEKDSKAKIDSNEATFYKQLVSIKKRFDSAIRSRRDPVTGNRLKISDVYLASYSKLTVQEFIANLSNPKFVEFAKNISLLPNRPSKSLLREMLEAIVNLFKSFIGLNPSVYDATVAVLEDFLRKTTSDEAIVPLSINRIPAENLEEFNPTDFINSLEEEINTFSEFSFSSKVAALSQKYGHIIQSSSLPSYYGEELTLAFTPEFLALSPKEQYLIVNQSKASNAWHSVDQDRITFTPGLINTSAGVMFALDRIIPDSFKGRLRNLLKSIVRQDAISEKSIEELLTAESPIAYIYSNVFSEKDRQYMRAELRTLKDTLAIEILSSPDNEIGAAFLTVVDFIRNNKAELERLSMSVKERSVARYQIAKKYIESIIKANLDLDKSLDPQVLIKTLPEIVTQISSLKDDPNPRLLSGLTLLEAEKQLNSYYAQIKDYQKVSSNPQQVNTILFSKIPKLENELTAIKALSEKDFYSKRPIVELIFEEIYPNSTILKLSEELENLEELQIISDAELELGGISEFIRNYDVSYELTLSESLKNTFRKIVLGNQTISPGLAYIKTMQLVISLDWNTQQTDIKGRKSSGTEYILEQLDNIIDNGTSQLNAAIVNNLKELITYSINTEFLDTSLDFGDKIPGIVLVKVADGSVRYAAYIADRNIEDVTTLTYQQIVQAKSQDKNILLSPVYSDTTSMYNWLNSKLSDSGPMSIKQFNRLFTRGEALNSYRAVYNTMGSMKETRLYTANRQNKKGLSFRFQRAISSGVNGKIKEQIIANLISLYETDRLNSLKDRFENHTVGAKKIKVLKTEVDGKSQYIKSFFEFLNIYVDDLEISSKEYNEIINDIDGFLLRTSGIESYSIGDEFSDDDDAFDIFEWTESSEGVSGYLTRFANLLGRSDKLVRNTSVRDANGNKFYTIHESSYLYDTLLNLIKLDRNNPVFGGGSGSDRTVIIPDYLTSNPDQPSYYDHNIFVRGSVRNRLYEVIEIDGARNIGNDSVTPYMRENMFFYFHRNFNQQFIDGLRQHRNSYFQSTFTPSDSPKALAVRVGLLSDNFSNGVSQVQEAIELILKQAIERRDLGDALVKNFAASIKEDPFRNFSILYQAVDKANKTSSTYTYEDVPTIAAIAHELITIEAKEVLKELTSDDVRLTLDKDTYRYVFGILDKMNSKEYPLISNQYGSPGDYVKAYSYQKGVYSMNLELLLPIFDLWYKNAYINGFFLNQLIVGDYANYKNTGAIIKRFTGAKAPRIGPLVDPIVGLGPTRKVLVLRDEVHTKEEMSSLFSKLLYGDNVPTDTKELEAILDNLPDQFDSTDAQGFSTKKWFSKLSRGYEAAWGLGDVLKPVHFGLSRMQIGPYNTSLTHYNKYSSIHLADEMTSKFPILHKLNIALEKLGVDEAIFNTGVKLGVPITKRDDGTSADLPSMYELINWTDEELESFRDKWQRNSIVELSNRDYGMQFNAASNPAKEVALFTQLMYIINAYPDKMSIEFDNVQQAARVVYDSIGQLISIGRNKFLKELGDSPKSLAKFIKRSSSGAKSDRVIQLLEAGVTLDNPLVEKKAIIALSSKMQKAAIKTKFKGGKLVLQTPEGIEKGLDAKLGTNRNLNAEPLSYRRESINGHDYIVAEVIVPKELLTEEQVAALMRGDSLFVFSDMLGFRLPSTEYHSAVAMRVVGVYSNKLANVVIAPRELVPIQGQDYDIDSLSIIVQETFKPDEVSIVEGNAIANFLETVHQLLLRVRLAEYEADPKYLGTLAQLRKNIQSISGLVVDSNEEDNSSLQEKIDAIAKDITDTLKISDDLRQASTLLIDYLPTFLQAKTPIIIGEANKPVGYQKVNSHYEFDPSFMEVIDSQLNILTALSFPSEVAAAAQALVKKQISKLLSVKEKALKNRVLDIMLKIISDRSNAQRTFTAISFKPLDIAIEQISSDPVANKLIKTNDNLDLSNPRQAFDAYLTVSSGSGLIGGFANAAKSFDYISRAGGSDEAQQVFKSRSNFQKLLATLKGGLPYLDSELPKDLQGLTKEDVILKLESKLDELNNWWKNNIEAFDTKIDNVPVINPRVSLSIRDGNKSVFYDKLASIDSDGKTQTTQAFSTLINAAVDDLNQGYLSKVRINSNTGPAITGMVSLGIPFSTAIKLLYQPILAPLSGGKVNNLKDWLANIQNIYSAALSIHSEEELSIQRDLDPFIYEGYNHKFQSMSPTQMLELFTPEQLASQLRVLSVFIKVNKIGTDLQSLAKFLNLLRNWDVLLEDLENVEDNLIDNIGSTTETSSGDYILVPRSDFSFNIPNLLAGSPHINEAYKSFRMLLDKVNDSFIIHKLPFRKFAKDILTELSFGDSERQNIRLLDIRRTVQQYLYLQEASEGLPQPQKMTYKGISIIRSSSSVFLSETANKIKMLQDYNRSMNISNLFLDNLIVSYDRYNIPKLVFKTNFGLQADDEAALRIGFSMLNQYIFSNEGVQKVIPSSREHISQIQEDLLKYSILTSGLRFGESGFANFISPSLINRVNKKVIEKLNTIVERGITSGFKEHIALSYSVINAHKLPWVATEAVIPAKEELVGTPDGPKQQKTFPGVDVVEGVKVYYDFKVNRTLHKRQDLYVRREFGKSSYVYRLVHTAEELLYYQLVGKATESVFFKVDNDTDYSIEEYFKSTEAVIPYYTYTNGVVYTNSKLSTVLEKGDIIYIVPNYSYDRLQRQRVEVNSVSKLEKGFVLNVSEILSEVSIETFPPKSEDESITDYVARLTELSYTPTQIGEALKKIC